MSNGSSSGGQERIPDLLLDRYLADDLPEAQRARVDAALAASDALRARLQALTAERNAFLAAGPADAFAHRVAVRLQHEKPQRRRPLWLIFAAPSFAAAAILVLAVVYDQVGEPVPQRLEERSGETPAPSEVEGAASADLQPVAEEPADTAAEESVARTPSPAQPPVPDLEPSGRLQAADGKPVRRGAAKSATRQKKQRAKADRQITGGSKKAKASRPAETRSVARREPAETSKPASRSARRSRDAPTEGYGIVAATPQSASKGGGGVSGPTRPAEAPASEPPPPAAFVAEAEMAPEPAQEATAADDAGAVASMGDSGDLDDLAESESAPAPSGAPAAVRAPTKAAADSTRSTAEARSAGATANLRGVTWQLQHEGTWRALASRDTARTGDALRVRLQLSGPAHVLVVGLRSDGSRQIYLGGTGQRSRAAASGELVTRPQRLAAAAGVRERIFVLVSTTPFSLGELLRGGIHGRNRLPARLPLTGQQRSVELMLQPAAE